MKTLILGVLTYLFSISTTCIAKEYPLIAKLSVTKNTIKIIPGKHFKKYLNDDPYLIEYHDPDIDLRKFDKSILIMPFIFDVLSTIFISGETYYVGSLDSEICKSLERFRIAFKIMYPKTKWEGRLICRKKIDHTFQFDPDRVLTLFSGGIDSTYSLLSNLNKTPIIFTQQGHYDSSTPHQWEETYKISQRYSSLFDLELTTASSRGIYLVNRNLCRSLSSDIYDWSAQAVGDFRWMGKLIPLMIFYKTSQLQIPGTGTWSYPLISMTNGVVKSAFRFGDCLRVYTDGFDVSRTQKTKFITKYLTEHFPEERWTLKVCFNKSGQNCGNCRKCLRTINDFYIAEADPNLFGFDTSIEATKTNLMKNFEELDKDTKFHQDLEAYFFNESLKFIEQKEKLTDYDKWLYDFLIHNEYILDIRQRDSNYYRNLEIELEKAWLSI